MGKNHSKIVCIKLVHLPYLYIYDARSHLHQTLSLLEVLVLFLADN